MSRQRFGDSERPKRHRETAEMIGFARRIIRAVGARVEAGLEQDHDLRLLNELAGDVDQALLAAVGGLRRQGWSWAVIADSLGVSRQRAHTRFAHRLDENNRAIEESVNGSVTP